MKSFKYYAIQIYDRYDGEYYTYEKFKDKEKAKEFLKKNYKNPEAKVTKIKIKFED